MFNRERMLVALSKRGRVMGDEVLEVMSVGSYREGLQRPGRVLSKALT